MIQEWEHKPRTKTTRPADARYVVWFCAALATAALAFGLIAGGLSATTALIIVVVVASGIAAVIGAELHRVRWISAEIIPRLDQLKRAQYVSGYVDGLQRRPPMFPAGSLD